MSKHTYIPVKDISEMDFSGEVDYYMDTGNSYEDIILDCWSIHEIKEEIRIKNLFTREELPWYENIPEQGILCWSRYNTQKLLLRVMKVDEHSSDVVCDEHDNLYSKDLCTPLTNQEIKQFLRGE